LSPLVLTGTSGGPLGRIKKGDAVIFYNIRGEREIELTQSLTEKRFDEFPVESDMELNFATMIEYRKGLNVHVAFPPEDTLEDTLSEVIARHEFKQTKITEAEKAVHLNFFLNGKNDAPFPGEERIIVPTRKDIALFDEAPEMSIREVTKNILDKIRDPSCNFIFANFPNVDVVGHIENEKAIIRAVEEVDKCTGIVLDACLREGISTIVCADHGTVEKWRYPDGTIDTGHTDSLVPFILIHTGNGLSLRRGGELSDIAPTIFHLIGIPKPAAMTGISLIEQRGITECRRLLLLVLDGWGIGERNPANLFTKAHTPTMDKLLERYPHTELMASGEAVGLPAGTVGNSEAGHLHIGAGRHLYSDRVKIDRAIVDGSFFRNAAFLDVMRTAVKKNAPLHLLGIVSFFSSHGSLNHLFALMELAKKEGVKEVFLHSMLGRRGELPESGAHYIETIEEKSWEMNLGKVVSVIGRYWAMDREGNWDRIEKTYRMLVYGEGTAVRGEV
jgi:2,3-bisphosphoglycerate-independent phosphoglycerate mutase